MSLPTPTVPVSWGELLDKIAILEIKAERIADMGKQANVRHELAALAAVRDAALVPDASLADLLAELKGVNQGSRMSLVGDDLEHIGVVPGRLLASAA
jgi:hypothetical protein